MLDPSRCSFGCCLGNVSSSHNWEVIVVVGSGGDGVVVVAVVVFVDDYGAGGENCYASSGCVANDCHQTFHRCVVYPLLETCTPHIDTIQKKKNRKEMSEYITNYTNIFRVIWQIFIKT